MQLVRSEVSTAVYIRDMSHNSKQCLTGTCAYLTHYVHVKIALGTYFHLVTIWVYLKITVGKSDSQEKFYFFNNC